MGDLDLDPFWWNAFWVICCRQTRLLAVGRCFLVAHMYLRASMIMAMGFRESGLARLGQSLWGIEQETRRTHRRRSSIQEGPPRPPHAPSFAKTSR